MLSESARGAKILALDYFSIVLLGVERAESRESVARDVDAEG